MCSCLCLVCVWLGTELVGCGRLSASSSAHLTFPISLCPPHLAHLALPILLSLPRSVGLNLGKGNYAILPQGGG
ncbi:uncharacterized protein B0H64DRAFT_404767 [Chaetomium fimeti]|uniref:Secreted protein n=1 Tax=Chaetomium fimeti TaxID=1854472 RepID=A0AAE0LQV7_9PEZI|nr:hypothetical protein B0H64DRAFT_404767 [Chaetomium fimeti]